jgi:ATP-dependent Zn protease
MKKLILLLLIILTSCASRKVQINRTEIKKDSIVETKVSVTTIETKEKTDSTNIITNIDNSEITITPIDTCKEIVVEGKHYKNVVLKIKKNKVNTLYTNNKTESNNKRIDSVATVKVNKTEKISGKNKTIEKKADYWWILWWILLILTLYQLWRNRLSLLRL